MGLFDRLRGAKPASSAAEANKPKSDDTFFLEPEASSTLGDVSLMKRSNTIRRTFPGTLDSPGTKEMVAEVSSMEARLEKVSEGLPGAGGDEAGISLTGGVPKPVKKTFAKAMSQAELEQRMKGSAVGVNVPGGPAAIKKEKEEAAAAAPAVQPQISQLANAKPGAIDPFKQMVKELNS
jgi:hypothetical protein